LEHALHQFLTLFRGLVGALRRRFFGLLVLGRVGLTLLLVGGFLGRLLGSLVGAIGLVGADLLLEADRRLGIVENWLFPPGPAGEGKGEDQQGDDGQNWGAVAHG